MTHHVCGRCPAIEVNIACSPGVHRSGILHEITSSRRNNDVIRIRKNCSSCIYKIVGRSSDCHRPGSRHLGSGSGNLITACRSGHINTRLLRLHHSSIADQVAGAGFDFDRLLSFHPGVGAGNLIPTIRRNADILRIRKDCSPGFYKVVGRSSDCHRPGCRHLGSGSGNLITACRSGDINTCLLRLHHGSASDQVVGAGCNLYLLCSFQSCSYINFIQGSGCQHYFTVNCFTSCRLQVVLMPGYRYISLPGYRKRRVIYHVYTAGEV